MKTLLQLARFNLLLSCSQQIIDIAAWAVCHQNLGRTILEQKKVVETQLTAIPTIIDGPLLEDILEVVLEEDTLEVVIVEEDLEEVAAEEVMVVGDVVDQRAKIFYQNKDTSMNSS